MLLLLREGEELRKHLSFTHCSRSRAGTQDPAEPCAGVRGGESTDPWMDRWTDRQEEQQCEPQRLVTTHREVLGDSRGKEHSRPFGSN